MYSEQEDQAELGEFHEGVGGDVEKAVHGRRALKCQAEDGEMDRQEDREQQSRQPMQCKSIPKRMIAMRAQHQATTAKTARTPMAASTAPVAIIARLRLVPRQRNVSAAILRKPIAA